MSALYSDVFCRVYNEFGWNYYPEIFGQQLLRWLEQHHLQPETQFDLVTCTGDALNHIRELSDIRQILQNVYCYTRSGGYFIFDILNENEIATSEPFEMDFSETIRVWFQMTRPEENQVNLMVRVFEEEQLQFEENIRETIHDPEIICELLCKCGFVVETCVDRLLEDSGHGTTWFVVARKP